MYANFSVSVIIPTYNAQKYINRAIHSVIIQEEVSEVLLIDDGSTDDSYNVCLQSKTLDKRIRVLQHEYGVNRGVSASRNLGIKQATCPFVAFLDVDDYYLPGRFKKALELLKNDCTIDGVYEMIGMHKDRTGKKIFADIQRVSSKELFHNLQPLGSKVWFHINGLTVKKSIFENSGYFDESLKTSEDTLQWFKMSATSNLVSGHIEEPVALSEKLATGLSSDLQQVQKDFILMLLKLFLFCKKIGADDSKKELVLSSFFFNISKVPYKLNYNLYTKCILLLEIVLIDPIFVLLKSKVLKCHLGKILGYNRIIHLISK